MPYIQQSSRPIFDPAIDELNRLIQTPGELNYVISRLAKDMIARLGGRYEHHNAVIGVLECSKLETYRRITAIYEDECIKKNGDIK